MENFTFDSLETGTSVANLISIRKEISSKKAGSGDFINMEKIKSILSDFHKLSKLGLSITDKNKKMQIAFLHENTCYASSSHKTSSDYASLDCECLRSVDFTEDKYKSTVCKHGLRNITLPILIGNQIIGSLMVGQFMHPGETLNKDKIENDRSMNGFDTNYFNNTDKFPRFSESKAQLYAKIVRNQISSEIERQRAINKQILQLGNQQKELNAMLEKSQEMIDNIFNCSPVAKLLVNRQAKIIKINPAAERYILDNSVESTGKGPGDILHCISSYDSPAGCGHGDDCKNCTIRNTIKTSFEERRNVQKQKAELFLLEDGKLRKGLIMFSTSFLNPSNEDLVLVNVEDISDEESTKSALLESEQKLEAFFKQSLDGFFFMMLKKPIAWNNESDKKALIEYAFKNQHITKLNKSLLKQYGYEEESEMIGFTPKDFFIYGEEEGKVILEEFYDKGKLHIVIETQQKNGAKIWVEGDYVCMYNQAGEITGHFGVQRNITEARTLQEELKTMNNILAEANASKDKFFSIIAHDLRSPFNAMLGFTELLKQNISEKNFERAATQVDIVYESAKQNYALLLNLLDWSRTQTGKINIEASDVEIKPLIEQSIAVMEYAAQKKQINVTSNIEDNINLYADKNMLKTITRNLIGNAIKYTHKGGKIEITAQMDSDNFKFCIKDNGIGINSKDLPKIFKIDAQHSTPGTSREKGTGLGLILCKEFVEIHGGQLSVESVENQGSTFKFHIPVTGNESENQ